MLAPATWQGCVMTVPEDLCPPFLTRELALQDVQARGLESAIREIEWGGPFGNGYCPSCGSMRAHGHAAGCQIGLALMPDHGAGLMRESVRDALLVIAERRRSLQTLLNRADREFNDLEETLLWVQNFLNRL